MQSNVENSFGLAGYVDILLVDKETQKVTKNIRKHNNLTEPFARWLMMGNLGIPNQASSLGTNKTTIVSNPVSRLLGSGAKYIYQACTSNCGTSNNAKYAMYLLAEPTLVDAHTQIPPYLNASLNALSDRRVVDTGHDLPLVVFYGTPDTLDDGMFTMAIDDANSKWNNVLGNPAFTTTYVKNDGYAKIYSIVLGAEHAQLVSSGQPATFDTRQSPSVMLNGWDNTWYGVNTTNLTAFNANAVAAQYLIAPFVRTSQINNRYGDGFYATTPGFTNFLTYYDLASKRFERNTAAAAPQQNMINGDFYSTTAAHINDYMGGFVLGTHNEQTRIVRVEPLGGAIGATTRTIKLRYMSDWGAQSGGTITLATLQTTDMIAGYDEKDEAIMEQATLPVNGNAPVMVARRGATEAEDVLDIFVSLGVGEFVEFTDESGYHPGGVGFELHKISVLIDYFRNSGNVADLTGHVINYGRVAVLPFAVGQAAIAPSTSANYYCTGSYIDGEYYLPFTSILHGCSPHNWGYDDTVDNARKPIGCCRDGYQPGVVLDDVAYTRQRDFLFGANGERRTMLTTVNGVEPIVTNQTQHWACSIGSVISGVSLDEPIIKTENQILVVRYTYTFDIVPEAPIVPDLTLAVLGIASIQANWTSVSGVARYRLQRTELVDGVASFNNAENVTDLAVPIPALAASAGTFSDTGLRPNRTYYYRLCAVNGGGSSAWATANATTTALTTQVAAPTFETPAAPLVAATKVRLSWSWEQPALEPYFEKYEIRYKTADVEDWTSLSDPALTLRETTTFDVTGLSASQTYTFELRVVLPATYYSTENAALAASEWISKEETTLATPAPTSPDDFALTPYDITHTALGGTVGKIRGTWSPEIDVQYDVRGYQEPFGYYDIAADVQNGEVISADLPYGTWRESQVRLIPYNAAYPKNSVVSNEVISIQDASFYRWGFKKNPQLVGGGSATIGTGATPQSPMTWSNITNSIDCDPATDAYAEWGNGTVTVTDVFVTFTWTGRHRLSTSGAMGQYPLSAWKVNFAIDRTYGGSTLPDDINAWVRVILKGVRYTSASVATTSPVIETSALLDTVAYQFNSNAVTSAVAGGAFEHIRQIPTSENQGAAFDAYQIEFVVCGNENGTSGFTTLTSSSGTFSWPVERLQLYVHEIDLISSVPGVESFT